MLSQISSLIVRRTVLSILALGVLFIGLPSEGRSQEAVTRKTPLTSTVTRPTLPRTWVNSGYASGDTIKILDPIAAVATAVLIPTERRRARRQDEPRAVSIDYSGPRFGVTYLPKAAVDSLKNHKIDVSATITQFGWQFEREIHVSEDGPRVLNEWVFLAGGLESGVFLPSMTWLIGARDRTGNEFGVGPNVSVAGVGLAAAAGVTVHSGGVNFPMNIAVAKSKTGARVSFLTGFTIH